MRSLATIYRPVDFDSVKSQESIIKILKRQLELEQFSNVYLLCGPSGCGKTTVARIFANEVNKGKGIPIEIDAASNNGVDNIRNIINAADGRSLDSEYKIFIIDECHMLTIQSWNALLKTIEEPPKYTIFIFCTTDSQKVPDTIKNRCMRLNFTRISSEDIKSRLLYICKEEGYTNYEETCDYIAKTSSGQMRDAIATLEKCSSYSNDLSIKNSLKAINIISYDLLFKLINAIIDGKEEEVLNIINDLYLAGNDLRLFIDQFLEFNLDLFKYCIANNMGLTHLPQMCENDVQTATKFDGNTDYYSYVINKLFELKNCLKGDLTPKMTIDIYMLRIVRCQ